MQVGADFAPPSHKACSMEGFDYSADPSIAQHLDTFLRGHLRGYQQVCGGTSFRNPCSLVTQPRYVITQLELLRTSPYSMTRDQYFVLDALPSPAATEAPPDAMCDSRRTDLFLFAGGSGRAFKFAPLIGRCLCDLVLGRQPAFDVAPLSARRAAAGLRVV